MKMIIRLTFFVVFVLAFIACQSTTETNSNTPVSNDSNANVETTNVNASKDNGNAAEDETNANSTSGQTASDKEIKKDKTPEPTQKPKEQVSPKPIEETKTEVKPTPPPTIKRKPQPTRRMPAPKGTPWQGKSDADRSGNQNN